MTEKFKFGPLIWNHIDDDDDSGNYWWPGLAPVDYDKSGIPVDTKGLQCLPMSCPVHPGYEIKYSVFNKKIKDHLPAFKEWKDWFENHFIEIDEARIKRDILRWYSRHRYKSKNFFELHESVNSLDEMVEAVWPLEDEE